MSAIQTVELDLARSPSASHGVFAALTAYAAVVWRLMRNRRAANRLHDLDDNQLDDIGLTRRDVLTATHYSGIFDDPAALLSAQARLRSRNRFERLRRD